MAMSAPAAAAAFELAMVSRVELPPLGRRFSQYMPHGVDVDHKVDTAFVGAGKADGPLGRHGPSDRRSRRRRHGLEWMYPTQVPPTDHVPRYILCFTGFHAAGRRTWTVASGMRAAAATRRTCTDPERRRRRDPRDTNGPRLSRSIPLLPRSRASHRSQIPQPLFVGATHVPAMMTTSFNPASSSALRASRTRTARSSGERWKASPMDPFTTGCMPTRPSETMCWRKVGMSGDGCQRVCNFGWRGGYWRAGFHSTHQAPRRR